MRKAKTWERVFLTCCLLAGITVGGLVIYAKAHPDSTLHSTFVRMGFHLE
jgi:type IV secretory pathway TrbF-like protein